MSQIICPKCQRQFDSNSPESFVTRGIAAGAGAGAGAWLGSGLGIVGGPLGGISGLIPGVVVGGTMGWFTADQFRRCPACRHIFKT
jgi:hypothetical protein